MLTNEMRAYLDAYPRDRLMVELVADFIDRFGLDGTTAGRILGEWVRVTFN